LAFPAEDGPVILIDAAYVAAALVVTLVGARVVLPLVYRRGRQVEFRVEHGSGTGEVLGLVGFRLRVRSLRSGREHAVPLTRVRRR
jgi:hypothetical protein